MIIRIIFTIIFLLSSTTVFAQTVFTKRAIIVIAAGLKAEANRRAKESELDPTGGDKSFTIGLSASGDEPATAYWCNWSMTQAQWDRAKSRFQAMDLDPTKIRIYNAATFTPQQVLDTLGLKVIEGKM